MSDHAAFAQQLRWEAANLRAMRLWLIEQQDLDAVANRIEAVVGVAVRIHESKPQAKKGSVMRIEDDDGMIVALSPAARALYVELKRARDRGHGYELHVYIDREAYDWRSFELYYAERDRALMVLGQLEELYAD